MLSGSSILCPTALDQKQEESDSIPKLLHMPVNVSLPSAVLLYLKRVLTLLRLNTPWKLRSQGLSTGFGSLFPEALKPGLGTLIGQS